MATLDRKQFKATSTKVLDNQNEEAKQVTGFSGRADYLKIEEGSNTFRLYPAHPGCSSFIMMCGVHWLPQEVKDGKGDDAKTVIKNKPIFNAKIHGGYSKDIVEEYITAVTLQLKEDYPDNEALRASKFDLVKNFKDGLLLKTSWVCYAHKIGKDGIKTFGRLQLPYSVKEKLNELTISGDSADSPIETDPFTDPDEGKAVTISYDKSALPASKYKANLEWRKSYVLTDEELEHFSEQDSLEGLYKNVYKRSDFEKAIEGLEIFDAKHRFNVFGSDRWNSTLEMISDSIPEDGEAASVETKKTETPKAKAKLAEPKKEESKEVNDDVLDMPLDLLDRAEMIRLIELKGLNITVFPKMSDEILRESIKAASEELEEETADDVETTEEEEAKEKATSKASKFKDQLKNKKA